MQILSAFIKTYLPLRDFLYILQLEEYDHLRALSQIRRRLLKRNFEKRDQLRWTSRAIITAFASLLLICTLLCAVLVLHPFALLVYLLLIPFITPYAVILASLIVEPFVSLARRVTLQKAKRFFMDHYPNTKVIAVTGSYGKTTTKYLLYDLLKYNYLAAHIPQNINTALGIASYLLHNDLPKKLDLLIVEMGAYTKGDIAEMCSVLVPDIAIITKLGDQHIERFGSFENLVRAKHEIFAHAKQDAMKFTTHEALEILRSFDLSTENVRCATKHMGLKANEEIAAAVASYLNVEDTFIADAIAKFEPVDRRNASYELFGVRVFDNSYNLSPQTAAHVLSEAKQAAALAGKDLVVMTAGISEQGANAQQENEKFAELLNEHASRVIIHPSIYALYITQKLAIPFLTVELAHTVLTDLLAYVDPHAEVLLHLPEQTDLSYL